MNRVLRTARIYTVNRWWWLYTPALVFAGTFGISWLIYLIIDSQTSGQADGGVVVAVNSLACYLVGVSIVAGTRIFPFSFSLGLTRRTFYRGTVVAGVIASLALTIFCTVGAWLERVTDFWGTGLCFFTLSTRNTESLELIAALYMGVMLLGFALGFSTCLVFKRWGYVGLFSVVLVFALAIAAFVMWMVLAGTGPQLLEWVTSQSLWLAVAALFAAAALALGLGRIAIARAVP